MSIVDTFHKATPAEPNRHSREWWHSDDATAHRAAHYLVNWLKEIHGIATAEPTEHPAIWVYDPSIDLPIWVRCQSVLQLRDFTRAYPDQINKLARKMLEAMETSK